MKLASPAAAVPAAEAERLARALYGIEAVARRLPGEWDDNFRLTTADGATLILKVSHPAEQKEALELQIALLQHLARAAPGVAVPGVVPHTEGSFLSTTTDASGAARFVRLLRYVRGQLMAETAPYSAGLIRSAGGLMAAMDRGLLDFTHAAAERRHHWDLRNAGDARDGLAAITDPARRRLAERRLAYFERVVRPAFDRLRQSVIHGDPNDYNIVVAPDAVTGALRATGAIDFGDVVRTATVCDLAITTAYAILNGRQWLAGDPLADAAQLVAGYDEVLPLTDEEVSLVYPLFCTRLTVSVVTSARRRIVEPENAYLAVSEAPAWAALERLEQVSPGAAEEAFRRACGRTGRGRAAGAGAGTDESAILAQRRRYLGSNLALSYATPLHIVRGRAQYLYGADGREYLDAYNNVAHVGHCHPRVVEAVARQAAELNTNTRYLHEAVVRYAARLSGRFPDPLEVCYFVNSASEANELALRIARAATGRRDVVVTAGAYHGNTQGLIDVSPYKHLAPGGEGTPAHVHVVPLPDVYRGEHRGPDAGARYAAAVAAAVARTPPSAFLIESLLSCGGQIVLPEGYLGAAFDAVRAAGGVCIVDEVQVGFGRVGSHFWGFELQRVVPDIVVLGKPMGNGHPLAGVITTRALAQAFDNGMEYFNTYGGNPVSMAAGLAVLDVLEEEGLQAHAQQVGARLLRGLRELSRKHPEIGDVRGRGLFIGLEFVRDPGTREPAGARASSVVNALKERGILTSTDGPRHNVIKLKPPMPFDAANADYLIETLDAVLRLNA
ncbi:MAG: aminotransferase class III-fold pyridoxal phosphate-dependent enzyme [Planctomycetes bacterium]|nr:aminotransferase class III-fold pyridoxal phosphate-dependent enzyme [Planctomycetota bacterium]